MSSVVTAVSRKVLPPFDTMEVLMTVEVPWLLVPENEETVVDKSRFVETLSGAKAG